MRRVGAEPEFALTLAESVSQRESLYLEGLWTHCAVADDPDDPFSMQQLSTFNDVLNNLGEKGVQIQLCHAANSALALNFPIGRYDMVRCGIATYGIYPTHDWDGKVSIRPAMSLRSEVSFTKNISEGEGVSYGLAWRAPKDTKIATIPMGYADGLRRNFGNQGGMVLIQGKKLPIVGNITMDQFLVDCGTTDVSSGDEVVLIGTQLGEKITASEWANCLGTIPYEVICGIESRIPRRYI
jgi:alanine racemase